MNLVWDPSKSCKACKCLGSDFHITLKLLVFLPEAKAAAKTGELGAGNCPKDREVRQAFSVRACACARAHGCGHTHVCLHALVHACAFVLVGFSSLLILYNRAHSAEET